MNVKVKVITNAKQNLVETQLDSSIKVKLSAVPVKGKANEELVEVLAKHYNIKKSRVRILKGKTSKEKILSSK